MSGQEDGRLGVADRATPEPSPQAVSSLRGGIADAAHTPGPWVVSENGVSQETVGGWCGIADCGRLVRYGTSGGMRYADYETTVANARLIAAAPEMFEALETMVRYSDGLIEAGHYDHREPRVQELYDMCAAAIAKAVGK
jgi:hypothetical protein